MVMMMAALRMNGLLGERKVGAVSEKRLIARSARRTGAMTPMKNARRKSRVATQMSSSSSEEEGGVFSQELPEKIETQTYNAIFISDTHLGTPGCQADALLDFLKRVKTAKLYLVGDIVDAWHLQETWYWPQVHNEVFSAILRLGRRGTKIIYTPGNHDDVLRRAARMASASNSADTIIAAGDNGTAKVGFGAAWSLAMGNVTVVEETVHKTAQGKSILVIHGDGVDARTFPRAYWTTLIIGWAYRLFMALVQFVKKDSLAINYLCVDCMDSSSFANMLIIPPSLIEIIRLDNIGKSKIQSVFLPTSRLRQSLTACPANCVECSQFLKRARQLLKQPYWSLATYVRQNTRFARSIIRRFEIEVAREARNRQLDGAICGHIHHPTLKWIGNRIYGNSGDWVDNCTALVERPDGSLGLMHYLPYFHQLQMQSEAHSDSLSDKATKSSIDPSAEAHA